MEDFKKLDYSNIGERINKYVDQSDRNFEDLILLYNFKDEEVLIVDYSDNQDLKRHNLERTPLRRTLTGQQSYYKNWCIFPIREIVFDLALIERTVESARNNYLHKIGREIYGVSRDDGRIVQYGSIRQAANELAYGSTKAICSALKKEGGYAYGFNWFSGSAERVN